MKKIIFLLLFTSVFYIACNNDEDNRKIDESYQPDIRPENFLQSTQITNLYFPAPPGKKYTYQGQTSEGLETIEEQRLDSTRIVNGIECIIVNFKAFVDGVLIEEAFDWYAQDNDGTVWYFGETVDNYNSNGSLENHDGSWEAGVDGAKPGIIMPANPTPGFTYREEYYFNEAEDEAEITGVNLDISIPFGNFTNCISTRNWTDLEPGLIENKYYAPGIGLVKEENTESGEEILLISIQ